MTNPSLSILIVNYQGGSLLADCLASLRTQTVSDIQVIVWDNASSDSSMAQAQERVGDDARFMFVRHGENLGFAAGNNRAAALAQAPLLALLNPDAMAAPDWCEQLLKAATRYPDTAMFGSTQLAAENVDRLDGVGDNYFFAGLPWRGGWNHPLERRPSRDYEVFAPCGAAALYRRDVFLRAGGFDERFFCYVEDVDLAFRLRLSGHHCRQLAAAVVHHVGGCSSGGAGSEFSRYHGGRNLIWCFFQNMPWPLLLVLLPFHVAAVGLLAVRAILAGRKGTVRGIRDGVCRLDWARRRAVQATRTVPWWRIARALCWSPIRYASRSGYPLS